jgi:hypothetical protein
LLNEHAVVRLLADDEVGSAHRPTLAKQEAMVLPTALLDRHAASRGVVASEA